MHIGLPNWYCQLLMSLLPMFVHTTSDRIYHRSFCLKLYTRERSIPFYSPCSPLPLYLLFFTIHYVNQPFVCCIKPENKRETTQQEPISGVFCVHPCSHTMLCEKRSQELQDISSITGEVCVYLCKAILTKYYNYALKNNILPNMSDLFAAYM